MGEVKIKAVDNVSFSIKKGEFVVIVGASGAGKTTILNLLGGMDEVSGGSISVDGNEISKYNKKMLTKYRREDIGFVFQFYNLVQNLNALENVELAVEICKNPMNPEEVLKNVGLGGSDAELSVSTFRRGTAEGFDCKSSCKEPETAPLR